MNTNNRMLSKLRKATDYDLEVMEGFAKDNIELNSEPERWKNILSAIKEMKELRGMPRISLMGVEYEYKRRNDNDKL